MSEHRLRARTVSEVIDAAFALYRQHTLQYIQVSALAFTPLLVVQLFAGPAGQPETPSDLSASTVATLVVLVTQWVTYSLMSAVIVKLGSQAYLGERLDLAQTVRDVLPRVPAVMMTSLLKAPLLLAGFLCFFVGVFYVIARFFAVATVVVLEGRGPMAAFSRSSELSAGRKGFILKALILVWVIYLILSTAVSTLAGLSGSTVVHLVALSVFTIVAYPVIGLAEMVLYYDARIRGEGFDLERMIEALDARPAPGGATP